MATKIKGELLILSVWDSSIYRPIACLTSNSLSETANVIESQTKCDPGVITKIAGSYSYELSAEGEYIDTTSATGAITQASHDYLHSVFGTTITWRLATGLTDSLTLDVASGLDIVTQIQSFPNDLVSETNNEIIIRKFMRIEFLIE